MKAAISRIAACVLAATLPLMAMAADSDEPPPPVRSPVISVSEEPLPRAGGVMVFGATGRVGQEVIKLLVEKHEKVTGVVRPGADTESVKAMGAEVVVADELDPASLKEAYTSAPFRAAIASVGGNMVDYRIDAEGVRNIVEATKAAGVPRLIVTTAIGAGDSADAVPLYVRWYVQWRLAGYYAAKTVAEGHIARSDIDYTIVRPGFLLDKVKPGAVSLVSEHAAYSPISRADLAKLLVGILEDKSSYRKILTAIDAKRATLWDLLIY